MAAVPSSEPVLGNSHCPTPFTPNGDRGWLGREPTSDERELLDWMKRRAAPMRILHVGVGNALLSAELGSRVVQGITKDGGEAAHARDIGLDVILCNKYDVSSYSRLLRKPFDCIVDVNIRSYACCDRHFHDYLALLLEALSPEGVLLTSSRGLEYLVPTSLRQLKALASEWSARSEGNTVIMRPRARARVRKWWTAWRSKAAHAQ